MNDGVLQFFSPTTHQRSKGGVDTTDAHPHNTASIAHMFHVDFPHAFVSLGRRPVVQDVPYVPVLKVDFWWRRESTLEMSPPSTTCGGPLVAISGDSRLSVASPL